jgi:hypothetical protein
MIISRPLARADGLLVEPVGEEIVVYDLDSKEAHCLKPFAAVVFTWADGTNTIADIAELASHRLRRAVAEVEVNDAIAQLEQRGLLDPPVGDGDGLSRREAVQRLAAVAGAAAATPLIASVVAPTSAMAQTLIPTGNCCGSTTAGDNCAGGNPSCASGHCCQNTGGKSCNQCKCVGAKNDCEIVANTAACTATSCAAGQECVTGLGCCTVIATGGGGVITC